MWEVLGEDSRVHFGHDKFEMIVKFSLDWIVLYVIMEFKGAIWADDINIGVLGKKCI